jgi:Sulfotransferase domain
VTLRVVGAGLPRTGTSSLRTAWERLLPGACCHMSALDGHPFALGSGWDAALHDRPVDWDDLLSPWIATADWPASTFWREALETSPDAVVVLSTRDSARTWWESMNSTVLHVMRSPDTPVEPNHLRDLLERFADGSGWDDRSTMEAAYNDHNDVVRRDVPAGQLVEWRASEGWDPLAAALGVPVPDEAFPWNNRRENWRD